MNTNPENIHLIAMGGSVMHGLAIALHNKGITVTGSDDQFFEPSRSLLKKNGLLPEQNGWLPENITGKLDAVVLGMHAHIDNPELLKAQELGLRIYSFPEFIYEQSLNKQRIVIGGSHGKTTITSMIMHVLKFHNREFDYVVGARLKGFNNMVKISDAPLIIIEGDEYLSSRLDPTPKFLNYHHHIGLISGIAWDHINVFKTEEDYVHQFDLFADATPKGGSLAYNEDDPLSQIIGAKERPDVNQLPYGTHSHVVENGVTYLVHGDEQIRLKIFGTHNMMNLNGAMQVCSKLSINRDEFYDAIKSFELPSLRLEVLHTNKNSTVFRDYAHAPSKVQATTLALKEQHPEREVVACLELHTYSSLNKEFLHRYSDTLKYCNRAIIFFDPQAVEQKKLASISNEDITKAFNHPRLKIFSDPDELAKHLVSLDLTYKNLLLMSSANFGGLNLKNLY
jgi:UDP-N-acetylmuramate: L-alanyl-gamma-D-glutamyl-meso-diaminopimelate ligase